MGKNFNDHLYMRFNDVNDMVPLFDTFKKFSSDILN